MLVGFEPSLQMTQLISADGGVGRDASKNCVETLEVASCLVKVRSRVQLRADPAKVLTLLSPQYSTRDGATDVRDELVERMQSRDLRVLRNPRVKVMALTLIDDAVDRYPLDDSKQGVD